MASISTIALTSNSPSTNSAEPSTAPSTASSVVNATEPSQGCTGDEEADGEAEDCRHPFGLLDPPQKVWDAHRRLVLGSGGSEDQELVDAFSVKNAYYGSGRGKQESMSHRFKVRWPGYSPSLAKRRRIDKDLQYKQSRHQP